jgi:hypothetical protein
MVIALNADMGAKLKMFLGYESLQTNEDQIKGEMGMGTLE